MSQIELDNEPDAVREFFERLPADQSGTVLSLRGRAVARVVPECGQFIRIAEDAEWTHAMNSRRHDLIDKQIAQTLTPVEAVELEELQDAFDRFLDRVAPLPLDHARDLLKSVDTTG